MIEYEKLDREFSNHSNVEPNVEEELRILLPMFGDHISMQKEKLEECTKEFQKVFRKAPLTVLKQVFLASACDHLIVSGVLRVLRGTKKAIDFRFGDGEYTVYVPLFRWLLKQPEVDLYMEDVYKGVSTLMTNITKCHDDGQQKVELEVAKATEILGAVVIKMIFNDDEKIRFLAFDVMNRIFQSTGTTAKKTRIAWTSEEREESVNPGLLSYLFLSLFHTDFVKHNLKFRNLLIETIESLGNRLLVDKYIIPDKYTNLLRNQMNKCEWVITFSFVKWFKSSLGVSLRPELPSSVHKYLTQDSKDKYYVINKYSVNVDDEILDFLVAFFDLSLFQEDGILHFFNQEKEFCVGRYTPHLGLEMSKALLVSAEKFLTSYNSAEGLKCLTRPLEWLVDHLEPPRDYTVFYNEPMNGVIFHAIRSLEPLFIVWDAATEALIDQYAVRSEQTQQIIFDFAIEYMKTHLRKSITELEEMALEILPPPAFHDWESMKQKIWSQCHVINMYYQELYAMENISDVAKRGFKKLQHYIKDTMVNADRLICKTERARQQALQEREESRKHRTYYGYAQPRNPKH